MTQDKKGNEIKRSKELENATNKRNEAAAHSSTESVNDIPSKVIVRRLPPSLTAEAFLKHISPVPDHDYFRFAAAELGLGQNAFCRAYINFVNVKDIWIFQEKFDGYVFLDDKGNEYPAVVEFAPYPRISRKKNKKPDPRKATVEQDPDYLKFLEKLKNTEAETIPPPESLLEEIEAKEKLLKANHGCPKITTPLIEYLAKRKEEKKNAFLQEKRRKEMEKRKQLEEERRKKLEKERNERRELNRQKQKEKEEKKKEDSQTTFRLLRNPEREKEKDEKQRQSAEAECKEEHDEMVDVDSEKVKPARDDDSRSKEQDKRKGTDINDRRDERKDGRDNKPRRTDKGYGERWKDDERRKDSESSTKDSNYGMWKKSDHYNDQRDNERERYKEKNKETDAQSSTDKDLSREKGQGRESGARTGGYNSFRGQDRDVRQRDYYRDGKRDDGRREPKGNDYKYDNRRPKDSGKGSVKDTRPQKAETGHGDHGGRQFGQESRGQTGRGKGSYDNRRDSGNYDNRRDSGNYDNRRDSGNYDNRRDSGNYDDRSKSEDKDSHEPTKKETSPQGDENATGAAACDVSESAADTVKSHKGKSSNDNDARRRDDGESSGRGGSAEKDGGASSRQRVRYKDRPERAIYNPAKRAVERQKEAGSNR